MRTAQRALVALACVACIGGAQGEDEDLALMRSSDARVRQGAIERLRVHRKQVIGELLKIVDADSRRGDAVAVDAMRALGHWRAAEAAYVLAENLEIKASVLHRSTLLERYPCADALASIGMPGVEALWAKVARTEDLSEAQSELVAAVMKAVLGSESAMAYADDRAKREKVDGQPWFGSLRTVLARR